MYSSIDRTGTTVFPSPRLPMALLALVIVSLLAGLAVAFLARRLPPGAAVPVPAEGTRAHLRPEIAARRGAAARTGGDRARRPGAGGAHVRGPRRRRRPRRRQPGGGVGAAARDGVHRRRARGDHVPGRSDHGGGDGGGARRRRDAADAQPLGRPVRVRRRGRQRPDHDDDQAPRRPRAARAQPDRRDARPLVPQRPLVVGGGLLRLRGAAARPGPLAAGPDHAGRRRRGGRGRGRGDAGPARRALAQRRRSPDSHWAGRGSRRRRSPSAARPRRGARRRRRGWTHAAEAGGARG